MSIRQQIVEQLEAVLKGLGVEDVKPVVDYPADPKHGDYSSNVALVAAKKLGKNPMEVGEEIAVKFRIQNSEFRIEVVRPGFVNFWVSDEALIDTLYNSTKYFDTSGAGEKKGKVVVEYSSPNIAKPFTLGHLRPTIIGDAVANLLEATGWEVYRDNHVGDWGTQFGKQIYAIKEWGSEEEIERAERPVKMLVDLYVKFHEEAEKHPEIEDKAREWFKKLEQGDEEARRLWQKCIDWSWKEFDAIYQKLGIEFTENNGRGYGESYFEDKMQPVIQELEEKGLLKQGEEGAKLIFFPNEEYPPLMILKKDGSSLYSTRDLATDKFRLEKYGKDILVINAVGAEQSLYFQQIYKLEEMLGWYKKEQRVHIKNGLYRFADQKMSTRKGNVIWLEDVLEEAVERAKKLGEDVDAKTAEVVAIGSIKWNDLKRESRQDIVFDWDDILNMQGNSGPYLQYTFARTQSVLRKAGIRHSGDERSEDSRIPNVRDSGQARMTGLEIEEREVLRLLARFEETVQEAAQRYAPHTLCTYLFELAQVFNLFYQKLPILKADRDVREFRVVLTQKTGEVIQKGLELLGIQAPEKM